MEQVTNALRIRRREHGISLFMVAAGLLVILGIAALAIDLASLYVARNEAQRAADAAALAGAKAFVDSGFTSGLVTQATAQSLATQRAKDIGGTNKIAVDFASIQSGDVTFDFSRPENPRITVVVWRSAARSNAMPTFFAKAFGILNRDISATATAEAYNSSGSGTGPTLCAGCIKPVVLPNCDLNHTGPVPNPLCPGFAKFVDPTCTANPSFPGICNPGPVSLGGVLGEQMTIRPGVPGTDAPAPSQYYSLDLDCKGNSPQSDIEACSTSKIACGDTLCVQTGATVGPTRQGFMNLISQPGQDTIDTTSGLPFTIHAGSSNPFVQANVIPVNAVISSSSSIVTVPIYDGHELCPGGSCGFTVQIIGYLQMFVTQVVGQANVNAVVLNVAGCGTLGSGSCGSGGGGSSSTISGGGGALIPVRLVRNPGS